MRDLLEPRIEHGGARAILLSAYLTHRQHVEFIAGLAARRDPEHEPRALEPIGRLDDLPIPDFSDFPWDRYPHRIVPLMASRGCGWGRCTFCSDVMTANGRGFRSRRVQSVLDEVAAQAERYATRDFIFLDIKLNSDVALWRGIIDGMQRRVPGARWIGTVHVDARGDHELDRGTLERAGAGGLTRVSFGLESGSQRVLRHMAKNCTVERNHAFLDRINLCRFKPVRGTVFERLQERHPERFRDVDIFGWDPDTARASYRPGEGRGGRYRRAVRGLLRAVHAINREPLVANAVQFDGLM